MERQIRYKMKLYRREPAVVDDLPVEISSSEDEEEVEAKEDKLPGNDHLIN